MLPLRNSIMKIKRHFSLFSIPGTPPSTGTPTINTITCSIFFSSCEVMKNTTTLLASLGFTIINDVKVEEKFSWLKIHDHQATRLSSGNFVIELISSPLFTKLRNLYGKKNSFSRLLEIKKTTHFSSSTSSTANNTSISTSKILPIMDSKVFSGFYPFTALLSSFPLSIPLFTTEIHDVSSNRKSDSNNNIDNYKYFSSIKEIILPCSSVNYQSLDDIQTILTNTFNIKQIKNFPGLYEILLNKDKLIVRTAPTDIFTVILKVSNFSEITSELKKLNCLGKQLMAYFSVLHDFRDLF